MKKKIIYTLIALIVLIQFMRPNRNLSDGISANDITKHYAVSDSVQHILKRSCNDCHSNHTIYPWYTNIQPVGWWMQNHVNDGKEELNFSEFGLYPPKKQAHKMNKTVKEVKGDGMPLDSYLWIHKYAKLTESEKLTITNWASSLEKEIRNEYNLPEEPDHPQRD
jgi:hypothetical protein